MIDTHCRIGRVRLKAGGAIVRVIRPGSGRDELAMRRRLNECVSRTLNERSDMIGFALVAWNKEGSATYSTGFGNGSPIGNALLPTYVSSILQTQL